MPPKLSIKGLQAEMKKLQDEKTQADAAKAALEEQLAAKAATEVALLERIGALEAEIQETRTALEQAVVHVAEAQQAAQQAVAAAEAAGQAHEINLVEKPAGNVTMSVIRHHLGDDEYKSIQRNIRLYNAMSGVEALTDFRHIDPAQMSLIINAACDEYPALRRFKHNWPILLMTRQYRRNYRKNGYRKGFLQKPTRGGRRNGGNTYINTNGVQGNAIAGGSGGTSTST
ncbi:hypothetical protein K474DRAFT_1714032 [Panus rudis PR-1116 ss-1]|nr:hypothetical protein K474DRAFT_1714032 [Panus rudis PR-1116 ss-1]